jgi:two-component system, sensor histidine kinase
VAQAMIASSEIGRIEGKEAARKEKSLTDGRDSGLPATRGRASRQRVLVVEDNPDTLEAMRVVVESWGYEVTAMSDAATALGLVRDGSLHAIVSDIGMPDVDGLSFATEVRKLDSRVGSPERIHLIAITGFASQSDRERALAAGFDAYLTKPINFVSLRELLDRVPATALEPQQA